jgi:hypothetical protein
MSVKAGQDEVRLAYRFVCASDIKRSKFQLGMVILIIFTWFMLFFSASFSKAYAFENLYFNLGVGHIAVYFVCMLGLAVASLLGNQLVSTLLRSAASYVLAPVAGFISASDLMFVTQWPLFRRPLFWRAQVLHLVALAATAGATAGLVLSSHNWMVNDLLAVSLCVVIIKVVRLQSFRNGVLLVMSTLVLEISVTLFIHYREQTSYDNLILLEFSSPALIQFPAFTPNLEVRCAWLPVTSVSFVGLLLAYLKRLDRSRHMVLYTMIGLGNYLVGSSLWLVTTSLNKHSWPYSIFTFPAMILLTLLFAYRRNELRTVFRGEFHEEDMHYFTPEESDHFRVSRLLSPSVGGPQ